MSSEEKDDIGKILADFKEKKEIKDKGDIEPLAPPVRREQVIDFAKTEDELPDTKVEKKKKRVLTPEEKQAKKEKRQEILQKIKKAVFNKKVLIVFACLVLVVAAGFGIWGIVNASKSAYLKPYEKKYPDVEFPVGIMEKYCDIYGENPQTVGYLEIDDIQLSSPVYSKERGLYPMSEDCAQGAELENFVIYLEDNSIEQLYKDAESYNNSSGFITYSDLYQDYTFKVVGSFYTNTNPDDDNGYIFPYNVTEKMTQASGNEYVSRLNSRLTYSTGITLTRQDKLIILSCDTDYREGYKFVVVGMLSANDEKPVATEKSKVCYQQVIYDELGEKNPYSLASKWYPEIIIKDEEGNESTVTQTINDYK